jgi:hypothetical protein
MNILKIIAISVFYLGLGGGLVFLGVIAIKSPQKIVDYQYKRFRLLKCFERFTFLKNVYENQIIKAENGYYAENWRKCGWIIVFMGLVYIYALIVYLIKQGSI